MTMTDLATQIENLAKAVRCRPPNVTRPTPRSCLEARIALLADRLERLRTVHQQQLDSLVRGECDVGSQLLQLETQSPLLFLYRFQARDRLKQRLHDLARERRRMLPEQEKAIADVQASLLDLLLERAQLDEPPDEHESWN